MIIFTLNTIGKPVFYTHAITNGTNTIECDSLELAEELKTKYKRYEKYSIIESDEVPEELLNSLSGMSFEAYDDANNFINNGGYKESQYFKIKDLEEQNDELTALVDSLSVMLIESLNVVATGTEESSEGV